MRIIAGEYRGRVLCDFKGRDIRPTSDKAREALFSILQNEVRNCSFLDLFGGTGSIGIEAKSRGAKEVVFCDSSKESATLIKKNCDIVKMQAEIYNIPCMYALNKFISLNRKFDIIFVDPPYASTYGEEAVEIIGKNKLLTENGIVVLEKSADIKEDFAFTNLTMYDKRKYGIAVFRFYRYSEEEK